ncbi:MAG: glutaredoxin [Clostridia bacterium]|nr:glutaredoxin [Clostridia bacterium]
MKNVTIFYLENCPYCKNARRALASLLEEKPAYAAIPVRWVEESRERELADRYDYYYVPTVFLGEEKLYEAHPSETYGDIREKLDAALGTVLAKER